MLSTFTCLSLNKGLNIAQNVIWQLGPLRISPSPVQRELGKRSKIGFINLHHWTNRVELISSALAAQSNILIKDIHAARRRLSIFSASASLDSLTASAIASRLIFPNYCSEIQSQFLPRPT